LPFSEEAEQVSSQIRGREKENIVSLKRSYVKESNGETEDNLRNNILPIKHIGQFAKTYKFGEAVLSDVVNLD
jgi:hypothetical protein